MWGLLKVEGPVRVTLPRLVGRRLQTEAVRPGNEWRGSPNLSKLNGLGEKVVGRERKEKGRHVTGWCTLQIKCKQCQTEEKEAEKGEEIHRSVDNDVSARVRDTQGQHGDFRHNYGSSHAFHHSFRSIISTVIHSIVFHC